MPLSRLRERLFLGGLIIATVAVQSALIPLSIGQRLRARAADRGRRLMASTRHRIARARLLLWSR
ncbi:MAG TPA: hypothetical protein VKT51_03760 [Candidatus Eremiobacteraceae bacterium]|nr:hypothetical protein [Candidatus Eremiobacteraceae bacterium]